jgi:hypothetical protein
MNVLRHTSRWLCPGACILFTLSSCKNSSPSEPSPSEAAQAAEPTSSKALDELKAAAARDASPYCKAPKTLVAKPEACTACEAANCDAPVAAGCDSLPTPQDRERCVAVLSCLRTTNCIRAGALNCYCGPAVDIDSCKSDASKVEGVCKAAITAGYPAGSSAAFIVDNSTRTDIPGALALALGQCDFVFCGLPAMGGKAQCVPYCGGS